MSENVGSKSEMSEVQKMCAMRMSERFKYGSESTGTSALIHFMKVDE